MPTPYLVPTENSGYIETLSGTPNTAVAIPIPGSQNTFDKPHSFAIFFEDGAGATVRGRFGFAVNATLPVPNPINPSTGLGHIKAGRDFPIPYSATHLLVASSTASALCVITWLYEK